LHFAGCSKGGAPGTSKKDKPAASAQSAKNDAAAGKDAEVHAADSNPFEKAREQTDAPEPRAGFKEAVRDLANDVLDPCSTEDWDAVAAAFPDVVEYKEWGFDRELPRDVFIKDVYQWRCEAMASPEMYETIPAQQRIVDVIAAGPGEARVLVAHRTLQDETLSWPPFGDWEGMMYFVREIDGALKIYKYGSCPADDIVNLIGSTQDQGD
jgi:hypothetical protein